MNPFLFIPSEVPSAKNSKQIAINKTTGKRTIISSKMAINYKENTKWSYALNRNAFKKMIENLTPPYYIGMYFYRGSKCKFDYNNIGQTVLDRMVEHHWIEDDHSGIVIPVILGHEYTDKKSAGVLITVIPNYSTIPDYIALFSQNHS